jgi:hypothetical protein
MGFILAAFGGAAAMAGLGQVYARLGGT